LEQVGPRAESQDLLYLPNGKLLKVLALGHGSLLADAFYVWAIQYYSDYEREDRYRYVEHVFRDVITELDPHYIDAYWLGALILILEARDLEAGLRLLERGAAKNPDQWILLYLAGWECYHAGQTGRAQAYFQRAMEVNEAPAVLPRLVAGIEARRGNPRKAIEMWREILEDPESDSASVSVAERQIRELRVRADVEDLERAVARFHNDNGRRPRSLEELVSASYIRYLPSDPAGEPYRYDPATGRISSSAGRVLGAS
jgi:tetratricopeptide (TPR) repeat protein